MNLSAVVDTGVLLGYLQGEPACAEALAPYPHWAISLVSWLEVMAQCPADLLERTRGVLRRCERLSVSEAIADDALQLMRQHPQLAFNRALVAATARSNRLPLLLLGEGGRPQCRLP